MGKKILGIVISALLCVASGCGIVVTQSPQEIEQAYNAVKEKAGDGELSEQDIAAEYCKLFENIAKGDKHKVNEYAALLRKITNDEYVFADEEVFEVAESYATVFSKMAEGYDDFGLQDLVVSKATDGKYTIGFDYCGEVRAYSVEKMNDGKSVKVTFYDAKPSVAFEDKYPFGEEHQVEGVKFKAEHTADHGLIIYIESETALTVEEKELTEVNRPEGTIRLLFQ